MEIEIQDNLIKEVINNELSRQKTTLEMIASENFASPEVMKVVGSIPVSYTHLTLPTKA